MQMKFQDWKSAERWWKLCRSRSRWSAQWQWSSCPLTVFELWMLHCSSSKNTKTNKHNNSNYTMCRAPGAHSWLGAWLHGVQNEPHVAQITTFSLILRQMLYTTLFWYRYCFVEIQRMKICSALSPQCNIKTAASVTWYRHILWRILNSWSQGSSSSSSNSMHQFGSQRQQWLLAVISAQMLWAELIACSDNILHLCTFMQYAPAPC